MTWKANDWARRQRCGSPAKKLLLLCLSNYADEHGACWPSQQTLAEDTEQTERNVRRLLAELEAMRLISRSPRATTGGKWQTDVIVLALAQDVTARPRKGAPEPAAPPDKLSAGTSGQIVLGNLRTNCPMEPADIQGENHRTNCPPNLSVQDKQPEQESAQAGATLPQMALAEPEVIAFPLTWKPCEQTIEMLRMQGLPLPPPPDWVIGFIGHYADQHIRRSAIPGAFLKWAARARGYAAKDSKIDPRDVLPDPKAPPDPPRRMSLSALAPVMVRKLVDDVGRDNAVKAFEGEYFDAAEVIDRVMQQQPQQREARASK